MSDLVPFVAAVLEDKVAADLKEENDRLTGERDRALLENDQALDSARWGGCVEITGKGGAPVYARGSMEKIKILDGDEETYWLELYLRNRGWRGVEPGLATCSIDKAYSDAEVRVNGVKIANVGDYDDYLNHRRDDDSDYGMYSYSFGSQETIPWGVLETLHLIIEPFPDHSSWPSWNQVRPPRPLDFRGEEDNVEVMFESIVFSVSRANMQEGDIFSRVIANGRGDGIREEAGGEESVLGDAPDVDSDGGEDHENP